MFSTAGYGVAWNGSLWVAVGEGTNTIATSTNGSAWTGRGTSIFSTAGRGIAWNGTLWVAVGEGTNTIATSPDGINWTGLGTPISDVNYGLANRRLLPYLSTIPVVVGGLPGQITYNNEGVPAGNSNLTFDISTGTLTALYADVAGITLTYINGATYPQALGNTGQVLTISSQANTLYWETPPAAGGSDTQVIFNQSGELGGSSNITFDYSSGTLSVSATTIQNNLVVSGNISGGITILSSLSVWNDARINGVTTLSAATISNNLSLAVVNGATYPQALGNTGQVLTISSQANTLYWETPPAAGSTTQITFNNEGVSAGSSDLTFNNTSGTLSVSAVSVTNNINLSSISFLGTYGSIGIDVTKNLQISASNNVVISPGVGLSGLFVSNIQSVASATPEGFYRLLYNPVTGQIVYATDLSP